MRRPQQRSIADEFRSTPEGERLFQREQLSLVVTELIFALMQDQNIRRGQLARTVGITGKRLQRILDCEDSLNLRLLSDIMLALGYRARVSAEKIVPLE